jgi:hypothetical protein
VRLAPLVAALASFGLIAPAVAGPARVDGLVGNPTGARNQLYVEDDLNVFLSPAQLTLWPNTTFVSLGVTSTGSFSPFGGGALGLGPVTVGLYLNRVGNRFSDAGAINNVLGNVVPGGHGNFLPYTGGTSARLFPPVDAIIAIELGDLQIGFGAHMAFGRTFTDAQVRGPEGGFSTAQTTANSSVIAISGGAIIPADIAAPEFWIRGILSDTWVDSFTAGPTFPAEQPTLSTLVGIRGFGSFGGGFRVPVQVGDVLVTPGFELAYSRGEPYVLDYLLDLPTETATVVVSSVAGTAGVGAEYSPIEAIRVVGTFSVEWDTLMIDASNGEVGELFAGGTTRNTRFRGPILSIGTEANPVGKLWIRGSVRAGVGASGASLIVATQDILGDTTKATTTSNLGVVAFSASGGAALKFEHVEVAGNVGGFNAATALGAPTIALRAWLDVRFRFPAIGERRSPPQPTPTM